MTSRTLTDEQLAAALRAHLPSHASSDLREQVTARVVATPQVRRLPWAFGLGDADPMVHRRAVLLIALLGLLAATSVAAMVGTWLRDHQTDDLGRSPEVDAFVLGSYEQIAELPAFRLVLGAKPDGTAATVYNYDGAGVLRTQYGQGGDDRTVTVSSHDFTEQNDRIGDHRVVVVSAGDPDDPISVLWPGGPNCAAGWESVEAVELIGRPTRHVRCTLEDARLGTLESHLWLDVETGIPLRVGMPSFEVDSAGTSVPLGLVYDDVTELEVGPQAADLFVLEGDRISAAQFLCETEGECASPRPSVSEPPAAANVPPSPAPGPGAAPPDLDAFVAEVHATYERPVPLTITFGRYTELASSHPARWQRDGLGNYRAVIDDPLDEYPAVVWLTTGGHTYETDPRPDGRVWRDWGQSPRRYGTSAPIMGLPTGCGIGWTYLGDDLVLDRPAAHITCGFQEFWIDREWMLVTRAHDHDPLQDNVGPTQVTSVSFARQPAELFAPPSPDSIWHPN